VRGWRPAAIARRERSGLREKTATPTRVRRTRTP